MDRMLVWNILNRPNKHQAVKSFLQEQKVGLCCLPETKIKKDKFSEVYAAMFSQWCIATNFSTTKGGRICLAWLDSFFQVSILETHDQFIHTLVRNIALDIDFQCTFIYGMNDGKERERLWMKLKSFGDLCSGPWVI